jgi:hypothetical protein
MSGKASSWSRGLETSGDTISAQERIEVNSDKSENTSGKNESLSRFTSAWGKKIQVAETQTKNRIWVHKERTQIQQNQEGKMNIPLKMQKIIFH